MTLAPVINPPTIFRLNENLLSTIFDLNADMFSDRDALMTTLWTSHVCGSWRALMLGSQDLWSKLIDLDTFYKNSGGDDWNHELLRRSGSALLWIKGDDHIFGERVTALLDIINEHWLRIQRLKVQISLDRFRRHGLSTLDRLYLPAPHLQTFQLHIYPHNKDEWQRGLEIWPTRSLFDDNAPLLRVFQATQCKFTPQTNWLSSLSSLHIGNPFNHQEVLFTLQNTPNLRDLRVDSLNDTATDTPGPLPRAHLPKLEHCILRPDFRSCITILEHLDPPSSCGLDFGPEHLRMDIPEDVLEVSFNSLSKFNQRYFGYYKPRGLAIKYDQKYFSLKCRGRPSMTIAFKFKTKKIPSFIFKAFTFPQFSHVAKLTLDLVFNARIPTDILMPFLSHFSSVVRLTIPSPSVLAKISNIHGDIEQRGDNTVTIFPHLSTIVLDYYFLYPLKANDEAIKDGPLHEILKYHQKHGCPIKVLDLTKCAGLRRFAPCFDYLEEMSGLRVHWIESGDLIQKYECGSGHPEKLPYSPSGSSTVGHLATLMQMGSLRIYEDF